MIQHRFYAPKGGQGTTVVACAFALQQPGRTLLVDDRGDCAAALGLPEPTTGVIVPVTDRLDLLVLYDRELPATLPAEVLDSYDQYVGDYGTPTGLPDPRNIDTMVIRADYLALRRAIGIRTPDRVVLIMEPGRALRPVDVARSLGIPESNITVVDIDPAITLGELEDLLSAGNDELRHVLARCSYLRDEIAFCDRSAALGACRSLDVLPPFAGG